MTRVERIRIRLLMRLYGLTETQAMTLAGLIWGVA